jgi:SAM-dependent methyltransferase
MTKPYESVNWGDLARLSPISDVWGIDRGQPVDRYYIDHFLHSHRSDIHGRVLEAKDSGYTRSLGGQQVTDSQVLDIDVANPHATVIVDLSKADALAAEQFDCFILTQTLHIIYDMRGAVGHALRVLRRGGVLLCTIPAVSRVNYEDGGLESGDYWRLTRAAVRRMFAEFVPESCFTIRTDGNVKVCTAFLFGLAAHELSLEELAYSDPWFPLVHSIRVVKP